MTSVAYTIIWHLSTAASWVNTVGTGQEVAIFRQQASEEITGAHFVPKFPQNGEFSAPNLVFLKRQQADIRGIAPVPATTPMFFFKLTDRQSCLKKQSYTTVWYVSTRLL